MVKKYIITTVIIAAAALTYYFFFNKSEEDIICGRLHELADSASKNSSEGASTTLLKNRSLSELFTNPCTIYVKESTLNGSYTPLELAGNATKARQMVNHMNFSFSDIDIELDPNGKKATIEFSARAQAQLKDGREIDVVRDLKGTAEKVDNKWKFSNFEVRQVMEK